jgi:hypothetical protein
MGEHDVVLPFSGKSVGETEQVDETELTEQQRLQQQRIKKEAERLCDLNEFDRAFQLTQPSRYEANGFAKAIGIEPDDIIKTLKVVVPVILKERGKAEKAEARREQQQEKAQADAQAQQEEECRQAEKAAKLKAEKEAKAKADDKEKTSSTIARLPVASHVKELERLAERIGEDIAALREEFKDFLGIEGGYEGAPAETDPWDEPVDLPVLLSELSAKVGRYVA